MFDHEYIAPIVEMPPQEAFYRPKEGVSVGAACVGRVSGEFVMCYPPGIPVLAPGERVTGEIVEYIRYAKAKGCFMTGPQDMGIDALQVLV